MKLFWNLSSFPENKLVDFYLRGLLAFEKWWYSFVTTEYQKRSWPNKGDGRQKPLSSRSYTGREGDRGLVPFSVVAKGSRLGVPASPLA